MAKSRLTILLSGMIAADPHQGGATWAVLQYLLGLKQLGHEVCFIEPLRRSSLRPQATSLSESGNTAYFREVIRDFGLEQCSALLLADTSETVGLGHEVAGEGIRVAGIRPGLIDTEIHASGGEPDRAHRLAHMVPMKRVGSAEEIANAIVWLMSDEASYVTSAILDVSGGR